MKRFKTGILLSLSLYLVSASAVALAKDDDTTSDAKPVSTVSGDKENKPSANPFNSEDQNEWETNELKAEQAFLDGDLAKARESWKEALAAAEKWKNDELNIATTLNAMNHMYMRTGEYEKAHEDLHKALHIRERLLPKDDLQIAETMGNLGLVCQKLHRHHEAEEWFKKSLDIKKKKMSEDSPQMAVTMHNLATLYGEERRYKESVDLLKKVLAIDEQQYGKNNIECIRDLTSLGITCYKCKEFKEAIDYFEQALATADAANLKDRSDLIPIHHYLGVAYAEAKDPKKAKVHYESASKLSEELHGKDHTSNTIVMLNLAHNAEELGDNDRAEKLYKDILEVERNRQPKQDYLLAQCLTELGQFYQRHAKPSEAMSTFEEAIKSYDVLPAHLKRRLYELPVSMSALLKEQGKGDEAEEIGQKYLHVQTPHGEKHFRL